MILVQSLFAQDINTSLNTGFVPPSPDASKLGSYGDANIKQNTGANIVNIPIFELKTSNLKIPISLSYYSNGVKVNDIASNVGINWILNAGGVINRTVLDKPDERYPRWILDSTNMVPGNSGIDVWCDYVRLVNEPDFYDSQMDIFSFNFNGLSGKFVLDSSLNAYPIPYQNIKINLHEEGLEITGFTITTDNGVIYEFGNNAIEKSYMFSTSSKIFDKEVNTAWYLTKIIHPSEEIVNFYYEPESYSYAVGVNETHMGKRICLTPLYDLPHANKYVDGKTISNINSVYLKKIETDKISATFNLSEREDIIGAHRIDSIKIYSNENNLKYIFNYLYSENRLHSNDFNNSEIFTKRLFLQSINKKTEELDQKQYSFEYFDINRLPRRLAFAQDHWGYFNGKSNTTLIPNSYRYEKETGLIGGNRDVDTSFTKFGILKKVVYPTGGYTEYEYEPNTYWGPDEQITINSVNKNVTGSNLRDVEQEVILTPDYTDFEIDASVLIDESNGGIYDPQHNIGWIVFRNNFEDVKTVQVTPENPYNLSFEESRSLNIDNIIIKAGGEIATTFVNINFREIDIIDTTVITGGLRVKKIKSYDNISEKVKISEFLYARDYNSYKSSGISLYQPIYYSFNTTTYFNKSIAIGYVFYSRPQNTITVNSNEPVLYSNVIESFGKNFSNGGISTSYENFADAPAKLLLGQEEILNCPTSNFGWRSGRERSKTYFKLRDTSKITLLKIENSYNDNYNVPNNNYKKLKGYVVKIFDPGAMPSDCSFMQSEEDYLNLLCDQSYDCTTSEGFYKATTFMSESNSIYSVADYYIESGWSYLKEKLTTSYDSEGENPIIKKEIFSYENPKHAKLTKKEILNNVRTLVKTKYYYPHDYNQVENFNTLINKNIIGKPIDTRTYKNGKLIAGNQYKYNDNGQAIDVYNFESLDDIPFSETNPYTFTHKNDIIYNSSGKVERVAQENNISTYYVWAYNNQFPVFKIESNNANLNISAIQTAVDGLNLSGENTRESIDNDIAALKTAIGNVDGIVSIYTYTPLFGVTSQTDPRGRTTYYIYDEFGRLKEVRDHDYNLIKQHEYNYATDGQ